MSDITDSLFRILEECETGMFTNASLLHDKAKYVVRQQEVLEKDQKLSSYSEYLYPTPLTE